MEQDTLFSSLVAAPLADRMRPRSLDDVVGQDHLLGQGAPLRKMIETGHLSSFILWGPPGCGKTTIAGIMANYTSMDFVSVSAVFSGIAELRKVFDKAAAARAAGKGTLLFVDEIHRFNRAQQDAFLPVVENGTVTLVGATTENPSFELNSALLSRCKVFVMKPLDRESVQKIMARAEALTGKPLPLDAEARETLPELADGDGRYIINVIETLYDLAGGKENLLDTKALMKLVRQRAPIFDKDREGHYNLISALHKSIRGSDVNAALYWAARMIDAGEDPLYLLRRLTRLSMEDVGLADPSALQIAVSCWDTYERLGSPEGDIAIAELVIYLATAPKSNSSETAWNNALRSARQYSSLMPPAHILNAPTRMMREMGYGAGYQYDHDLPDAFSGQNYFPDGMPRTIFYNPPERGFEREIRRRLAYWDRLRAEKNAARNEEQNHSSPMPPPNQSKH